MSTEKFHHEVAGKKITLPYLTAMPFGVARRIRKLDDPVDIVFEMFEAMADARNMKLIDQLPVDKAVELFAAWEKASGVTLGESEASSTG